MFSRIASVVFLAAFCIACGGYSALTDKEPSLPREEKFSPQNLPRKLELPKEGQRPKIETDEQGNVTERDEKGRVVSADFKNPHFSFSAVSKGPNRWELKGMTEEGSVKGSLIEKSDQIVFAGLAGDVPLDLQITYVGSTMKVYDTNTRNSYVFPPKKMEKLQSGELLPEALGAMFDESSQADLLLVVRRPAAVYAAVAVVAVAVDRIVDAKD